MSIQIFDKIKSSFGVFRKSRKGQTGIFGALIGIIIGLAAFSIGAVVTFLILATLAANPQVVADPNTSLAVATTTAAAATVPEWLGIVVIAVIGALLLSVVYMYMRQK